MELVARLAVKIGCLMEDASVLAISVSGAGQKEMAFELQAVDQALNAAITLANAAKMVCAIAEGING